MSDVFKAMLHAAVQVENVSADTPVAFLLTQDHLARFRESAQVTYQNLPPGLSFQGVPVYRIRGLVKSSVLMADGSTKPL